MRYVRVLCWVCAWTMAACASEMPAGEMDGGGRTDAGPTLCDRDERCDDGVFCNGAERCAPGDPAADAMGCAPPSSPACMPSQTCDEMERACLTACDVESDADGDGADAISCGGTDCDDANARRYPGATEICDTADEDEDCDPSTFGFRDADGDRHPDARCCNVDGAGARICGDDCNDARPDIFTGLVEACDGSDNDCDGTTDEGVLRTFYADLDRDGFGDEAAPAMMACVPPAMHTEMGGDCDDSRSDVSPVSPEICDATDPPVDENCDMVANPASLCMCEGDISRACMLPGRCSAGTERCVGGSWGACSITGIAEICNAEDDDCDGRVDETTTVRCYDDADDDGYPAPGATPADVCPTSGRGGVGGCPFGLTNREPLGAAIDCDDASPESHPGGTEVCDAARLDEDCDGMANPDPPCACSGTEVRACPLPGRCAAGTETCADGRFGPCSVSPEAETCNGVDDDCDGMADEMLTVVCHPDGDDDSYSPGGASMLVCPVPGRGGVGGCPVGLTNRVAGAGATDCDDANPGAHPMATEQCDGARVDEDCDGMANPNPPCACSGVETRGCVQPGRCAAGIQTCGSGAWGACSISPEVEGCNSADDDCDGRVDEMVTVVCYTDGDNDTYSPGGAPMDVCPVPGRASVGGCPPNLTNRVAGAGTTDCNDGRSDIYPGAPESCVGSDDDDCDGMVNEGCTCTVGGMRPCMRLGVCASGTETCQLPGPAWVCDRSPGAESCNSADDDCDGRTDEGTTVQCWVDVDRDTYAPAGASMISACSCPLGTTSRNPVGAANTDCDDGVMTRYPGAPEICNMVDDDCDPSVDEGLAIVTVYVDTDGDGRRGTPQMRCAAAGDVTTSQDCNEMRTDTYVGAPELCDRRDNNCSSGGGVDASEDMDMDGYAPIGGPCSGGSLPETDCDDADATDYPGAPERCGAGDNDCDGAIDEEPAASAACSLAAATDECVAGACAVITCNADRGDCDGNAANGCETDLDTSALHCGACGVSCGLGGTCSNGECNAIAGVATGLNHSCAVRATGQVACWGSNANGELGNGTMSSAVITPVLASGLTDAVEVVAGGTHTCARRAGGTVMCWGNNAAGQLGDTTTTRRLTPVTVRAVSGAGDLTTVVQIAAGVSTTCARLLSGEVVCWGEGSAGQLGNGASSDSSRPVVVLGVSTATLTSATDIAVGGSHACAVRSVSPYAVCWGSDAEGQLGSGGGSASTNRPVAVSGATSAYRQVVAGNVHSCARTSGGSALCWGDDFFGQLGNDTARVDSQSPVAIAGVTNVSALGSGNNHTCAVTSDRTMFCWGINLWGNIGTGGTSTEEPVPVQTRFSDWATTSFGGGLGHTCARRLTGQVSCWGENGSGMLGTGTTSDLLVPGLPVLYLGGFSHVGGGNAHTCARRDSGEISCWGSDSQGGLGNGSYSTATLQEPQGINYGVGAEVEAGVSFACARSVSGSVSCWGHDLYGQVGNGAGVTDTEAPSTVSGFADARDLAVGPYHACVARLNGTVRCWGRNDAGQIGSGGTVGVDQHTSVAVTITGASAVEVAVGRSHSCARVATGEVYCWGSDASGQLGNGAAAGSTTPQLVSGITNAMAIASGDDHACALLATREVRCWGSRGSGRLGDGMTSGSATAPVTVSSTTTTLTDATGIFAAGAHTCVRRASGAMSCWGANAAGQLGVGDTSQRTTPAVTSLSPTDALYGSCGAAHTCVSRATGALACWGEAGNHQLGNGSTTDRTTPTPVIYTP